MNRPWSCDTFVGLRDATADGRVIFGKNSDRPVGEAQPLRVGPAREAGGRLELAYLGLPDEGAYAHIGSAPFWCWGYEFGINEHSVAIGNEAQFTRSWAEDVALAKQGNPPAAGIIGMELVRLGLERGATAREALAVMTELLEEHGQWGSGMFGNSAEAGSYDNSYLIADRDEAWALETSGREWIARRVESGVYSISNEPSIRTDYDLMSDRLLETAEHRGWIASGAQFDYAASHVDPGTPLQVSHMRQRRSRQLLEEARGRGGVSLASSRGILRDHFEGTFLDGPYLNAARPDFLTLCMHEHAAGFTWGNTAASVVVELGTSATDLTVVWYCALTPCSGVYVPLFLEPGALPGALLIPVASTPARAPELHGQPLFDPSSYWWRFQNLLDAAKGDEVGTAFGPRSKRIRERFDPLEAAWAAEVALLRERWNETETRHAGASHKTELVAALRDLTEQAIGQVDAELDGLFREFDPDGRVRAFDPRWRASERSGSEHSSRL